MKMADTQFRAEDWVYVPDAMGRIGQGYYKHRTYPQKTMTVAEFERKRTQPVSISKESSEQNINKNRSRTRLHTSGQDDTHLTPWSNPLSGEQSVSEGKAANKAARPMQETSGRSMQTKRENRQAEIEVEKKAAEEKRKKRQQSYQSQGESNPQAPSSPPGFGGYAHGVHTSEADGGTGNSKVICTEMVAQGLMTTRARQACLIYAHRRLPPSFMEGYHFWAVPYVRLMRRFAWATRLVVPFVHHRTQEVRYRLGLAECGSWRGKVICALHDPLCSLWGRWIRPGDYRALYGGLDVTES